MGKVVLGVIIGAVLLVVVGVYIGAVNVPQFGDFGSQSVRNAATNSEDPGEIRPGQLVVRSVEKANSQASSLADAFDSMNMNPVGSDVSYGRNASETASPKNSEVKGGEISEPNTSASATCELTDEEILGAAPELAVDEDPAENTGADEKAMDPTELNANIARAYKLMEAYAAVGTVCNDKYVKASELLQQDWDAQYKVVRDEYNNFHDMVELAKSSAGEYFAVQSDLTSSIKNVELRQEQRQNDMREVELFDQWKGEADNTVLAAYRLMDDIEDMRIVIEKAALSAHFAALNKQALTLPASLTELHSQLDLFHDRSKEIRQAFGGSPEDSQIN